MSDSQTFANEAAYQCSLIFSQRPYGTGVQFEDIQSAQREFAVHIQAACDASTKTLLAACEMCDRIITEIKEVPGGWDSGANRQNLIASRHCIRAAIARTVPNE